jgi:hypothetical protein
MVTATQRRQVVTHLRAAFGVSARRACRLVALSRSRWHYQPRRPHRDAPVRARLRELAAARPRFGYQRLHLLLRREGLMVNHKRVYRSIARSASWCGPIAAANTRRSPGCRSRLSRRPMRAGGWTSSTTPAPTAGASAASPWSTSTPANAR